MLYSSERSGVTPAGDQVRVRLVKQFRDCRDGGLAVPGVSRRVRCEALPTGKRDTYGHCVTGQDQLAEMCGVSVAIATETPHICSQRSCTRPTAWPAGSAARPTLLAR